MGLKREWVISNGIGGYASSTIIGMNTRKYHGLLIAPIIPPAGRQLVLSKIDEMLEVDGRPHILYTNMNKGYTSEGYKYLTSFQKEYMPIFTYKVEDVEIEKTICLEYENNTVVIQYKIKNQKHNARITLAPLLNFRNYHYTMTNHDFKIKQTYRNNKLEVILDENTSNTIYLRVSGARYIQHENNSYKNMFYVEEENRGFVAEENHAIPGVFEVDIEPYEEKEISIICSLEENIDEKNAKEIIEDEKRRLNKLIKNSLLIENKKITEEDDFKKQMLIASDNFVAYRPMYRSHTILAGYPWFLDWSRDTLISFEGLLLLTKRFKIAREVLLTCVRDIKFGLIPNGYSDFDNKPLYNSVDASLLLFEQVQKYIDYTNDYKFVEDNLYTKLKSIISNYSKGIDLDDNNIYLDIDGLIVAGKENTQNTWMDAKYDGKAVTPRNGKAVEINALWYNALRILANLASKYGEKEIAKEYEYLAEESRKSFNKRFYNKKKKCLYDVLGDDKIRPNQLFALSLTYPVLNPRSEEAKNVMEVVEQKLLTPYGLKTLAKGEPNYIEIYEGDGFKRDTSYHQGITWVWLLGLYYDSLFNMMLVEEDKQEKEKLKLKLEEFKKKTEETFKKEIYENACICGIAELYDSAKPYKAGGTINQAWSVAEVFRIIQ
ncbi:MAG: glycogen debranching protein [Clostridia bacterium]|nr:glycogen debranching protein [Clostridia bacterium]